MTKFDPELIRSQIKYLETQRNKYDFVIKTLETALRSLEGFDSQAELAIDLKDSDITLQDAVRGACLRMVDGITRQRVLTAIQRERPFLKPKSSSVAAALLNLAKGESPALHVAIEGKGRTPSLYSTEGTVKAKLSTDEIAVLLDSSTIKGIGGWQSLWLSLQKSLDKASGVITLTPEQRARIYQYYHNYGVGGWQNKVARVFQRELPQLFTT